MDMLHLGFNSYAAVDKIVAILPFNSAAVIRDAKNAKETGTLINAAHGRKYRALIYLSNGEKLAATTCTKTLVKRLIEMKG